MTGVVVEVAEAVVELEVALVADMVVVAFEPLRTVKDSEVEVAAAIVKFSVEVPVILPARSVDGAFS